MKETRTLEFKAEITNTFLRTVSAFANYGAGNIIFGLRDDGKIIGIDDPDKVCLDIENRINDTISPKPEYTLSVNHRTKVITLRVEEGVYKPYLYRGKAYRRSDTSTVEVDQIGLNRLTLEGSNLYYEELSAVEGNYTFQFFEKKLRERIHITEFSEDILRTFGFYTKNKKFNNAAALFADENTFPGIDIARFGETISEIMDRFTASGISILKQYDDAVDMYRRYYQYEKIEGISREKIELVPEVAFREAIANALIHRTWDTNAHIKVSMYKDRIEIVSPGGLPTGLEEEEYLNGRISSLRNPITGNVFFRLHYVEMFGTGIRRIKESYARFAVKPVFSIYDNSIMVTLPVAVENASVTVDGKAVMELLQGGVLFSSRDIGTALGWSKDKAIRTLNSLKTAGYIEITGAGRSTKYKLKS